MATNLMLTCDYLVDGSPCGAPAGQLSFDVEFNAVAFHADLCESHVASFEKGLVSLGAYAVAALAPGRKLRNVHIARSGKRFKTADARHWAIEQGLQVPKGSGRVSDDILRAYGDVH